MVQDLVGNAFDGLSDPGAWNFTTAGPTAACNIRAGETLANPFVEPGPGNTPHAEALNNLPE